MDKVTKQQIEAARNADLTGFLLDNYPDEYIRQGTETVRSCDPDETDPKEKIKSISMKLGEPWFYDFKTGEGGNPIDYLVCYLGYDFVDAVNELQEYHDEDPATRPKAARPEREIHKENEVREIVFPKESEKSRQMYGYLCKRGIPADVITDLKDNGLLYQEAEHNNIVFVNRDRDFAEIRGTYSYGVPFHQVIKTQADRYWDYSIGTPEKAYICEAAIDAISLYLLKEREGAAGNSKYVSIAGVANQKTIDRIKQELPVVIAVDNDDAGQLCRERNPDCEVIIPVNKDWNEDLVASNME